MAEWDGDSGGGSYEKFVSKEHIKYVDQFVDRSRKSIEYHIAFESEKWMGEIPDLQFPPNWKIKIIPPFGCAVVRFMVSDHNGSSVSVYLDCYALIGATREPYWEIYPGDNDEGEPERFSMNNATSLLENIKASLTRQNPAPYVTEHPPAPTKPAEETKDRFTTLDHNIEES